jgi:hypothetical protein
MPKKTKTAKFAEKTKRIYLAPFDYTVNIVVSNDVKKSAKSRTSKNEDVPDFAAIHIYSDERPSSCIILPEHPDVSYVSHETFHCVWRIMKYIGAEFNNEIMAYLNGYLVQQICRFVTGRDRL